MEATLRTSTTYMVDAVTTIGRFYLRPVELCCLLWSWFTKYGIQKCEPRTNVIFRKELFYIVILCGTQISIYIMGYTSAYAGKTRHTLYV